MNHSDLPDAISQDDLDIDEDDLAREIMRVQNNGEDEEYDDEYGEIIDGVPVDEDLQEVD